MFTDALHFALATNFRYIVVTAEDEAYVHVLHDCTVHAAHVLKGDKPCISEAYTPKAYTPKAYRTVLVPLAQTQGGAYAIAQARLGLHSKLATKHGVKLCT